MLVKSRKCKGLAGRDLRKVKLNYKEVYALEREMKLRKTLKQLQGVLREIFPSKI